MIKVHGDLANKIVIYDTTLRDGSQGEGISFSVEDKIRIAHKLDWLGVDYIEGGWPGSNPKDLEFFRLAAEQNWQHAKITAFSSTRRPGAGVKQDANIQTLAASGVSHCAIFGKTWDFHVLKALETTLEENLRMVEETVAYLTARGIEVMFDGEHFFDGFKNNPDYALQVLKAARAGGAQWLVLCDTNGGCLPWEVEEIVARVYAEVGGLLGIHAHNDSACAVTNSLAAVKAGAAQVQGTINGYGERCGNADLSAIIPNLELKMGREALPMGLLSRLTETARFVAEIANMPHANGQPFVGYGAFAHKGGIHVSALAKDPLTYEHLNPEEVGNSRRVLVSELSGMSNLLYKARELGIEFDEQDEAAREVVKQLKELEHMGFQFEGADASLELFLRRHLSAYKDYFKLANFKILVEKREEDGFNSEAMVKLGIADEFVHTISEGDGPVNALDNALRKALCSIFPAIGDMHLTDYKVRVLDGIDGTAARVRVMIDSADQHDQWTTVGVSENIIEASWQALEDSVNYKLLKDEIKS
ncbi:MAG: citramalate synthase [Methylocystaceae bacterium]